MSHSTIRESLDSKAIANGQNNKVTKSKSHVMNQGIRDLNKVEVCRRKLLKLTGAGLLGGAATSLLFHSQLAHSAGTATGSTKVLVIYYSYTGTTRIIVEKIREKTGADLVEIETVKRYPANRSETTKVAKRELENRELPELKKAPPDISSYDLILVGSPIWWYTVSTPVMSFLKQADFAGKRAAAFCTHEGGIGKFFPHFKEQARNAVVLDGLDLFKPRQAESSEVDKALDLWLGKLQAVKKRI